MKEMLLSAPCKGRPETAGLSAREVAVYDFLDALQIPYLHVSHAAAQTMEDCAEIDTRLGVKMCKNLFLCNRQQTEFYLLLMPGEKPFKTKELSAQLGVARLSFASGEKMQELLGLLPGSVSVMGLMNDKGHAVRLLVDEELLQAPLLGCHPCVNTASLAIETKDIFEKFLPKTGHIPTAVVLLGE